MMGSQVLLLLDLDHLIPLGEEAAATGGGGSHDEQVATAADSQLLQAATAAPGVGVAVKDEAAHEAFEQRLESYLQTAKRLCLRLICVISFCYARCANNFEYIMLSPSITYLSLALNI